MTEETKQANVEQTGATTHQKLVQIDEDSRSLFAAGPTNFESCGIFDFSQSTQYGIPGSAADSDEDIKDTLKYIWV